MVLDLYSRRVVRWSMQATLERSLVIESLQGALSLRHPAAGLICHSDRGRQYASADYHALLSQAGAVCNMSRRGNCYDNAAVVSFFAPPCSGSSSTARRSSRGRRRVPPYSNGSPSGTTESCGIRHSAISVPSTSSDNTISLGRCG